MESEIKEWLKDISRLERIIDPQNSQHSSSESYTYPTKPFNIEIGEIDIEEIDRIELESNTRLCAGIDEINESTSLNGYGSFTLKSGDYFKGDFYGCISDREGELIRLSTDGSTIEGTWKNGRAEVSKFTII